MAEAEVEAIEAVIEAVIEVVKEVLEEVVVEASTEMKRDLALLTKERESQEVIERRPSQPKKNKNQINQLLNTLMLILKNQLTGEDFLSDK